MSIVLDNTGSNQNVVTNTTISWAQSLTSVQQGILYVVVDGYSDNATVMSTATYTDSGSTPHSLTHLGGIGMNTAFSQFLDVWYALTPGFATGVGTVSMVVTATVNQWSGASDSWTGVDQTTPNSGFATNSGNSVTPTITVTSPSGETAHDAMTYSSGSITSSCNHSLLVALTTLGDGQGGTGYTSGVGSTTMTWTLSSAYGWWNCGWSMKPYVSAGGSLIIPLHQRPAPFKPMR